MAKELSIATEANKLLEHCSHYMFADWKSALSKASEHSKVNYLTSLNNLSKTLKKAHLLAPEGVYMNSKNIAIIGSGVNKIYAAQAYQLLKREQRIMQVGGGAGNAIVVLNKLPLELDGLTDEEPVQEVKPQGLDSKGFLKGLADYIEDLEAKLEGAGSSDVRVMDMAKAIEAKDAKIAELEEELKNVKHLHAITSWTL